MTALSMQEAVRRIAGRYVIPPSDMTMSYNPLRLYIKRYDQSH